MIVVNKQLNDQAKEKRSEVERYLWVKRVLSLIIGIPTLIFIIPFGVIISAIIMLDDPKGGSPFFVQNRVGKDMKVFKCYKFRTMKKDAPHEQATKTFVNADAYITRAGRILRKTSLDELPQVWNVVKGDMALVGPRPLILAESEMHEKRMQRGIYMLRPGITGLAQVKGRDSISNEEKLCYDDQYLKKLSFGMDVRIVFSTFLKVISMSGIIEGAKGPLFGEDDCCIDNSSASVSDGTSEVLPSYTMHVAANTEMVIKDQAMN